MIAIRKRFCLIALGPALCFVGILYTVFYTEYKLPRMIKRMQNNIESNKEVYFQNETNEEGRKFSLFPPYYSNEKNEEQKYEETENSDGETTLSLEECQIWIPIRDSTLFKGSGSWNVTDKIFLEVCSIESAIKSSRADEDTKTKICLLIDRFDKFLLLKQEANQSEPLDVDFDRNNLKNIRKEEWFKVLKRHHENEGNQLSLVIPDYATVFSGTIFEETYINSADLSYLSPALIWSILWKYGGLLLHPGTLLFPSFRSYYNFVALNQEKTEIKLNILQFVDRHHELAGKSLHHMMELSMQYKAYQQRKEDENLLRMEFVGVNVNDINGGLVEMTTMEWTKEVTRYCNRSVEKLKMNQMCQDVEIVGEKSIPTISLKKFIELVRAESKTAKKKRPKKKIQRQVLEKDVLAIQIVPSNSKKTFLLTKFLKEKEESNPLRQSLQTICPASFAWFLNK